ncbi:MAG: GNAT family N-acetyltransferase [Calditrichia bacterium]
MYQEQGKDVLNYFSTFVPEELRGEGIAAQLAESALNYARKHHYKIIPTCSYISLYIKRHEEYQDLVK